jgi:spermidine synthase
MRDYSRRGAALMAASGFAALGYQIVWTQQSTLWLGAETAAVLAVVAAFFGGMALGALGFGRRINLSAHPARWYAACEAIIGMWALVLALIFAPVSGVLLDMIGPQPAPYRQWAVVFCGTFLMLLPATAAMGATLPAMERIVGAERAAGSNVAALYAANTFGAVLGVLGAAFFLVPRLGLILTATICAVLNLFCAVVAWRMLVRAAVPAAEAVPAPRFPLRLLALTGLLGIGYEVLVVRVLSQVAENTVYTFAMLLAVYLIGTTLGAAAYGRWGAAADPARQRDRLMQACATACLLGVISLVGAATLKQAMLGWFGPGMTAALAAEALLAAGSFLLPAVAMGALFSHLAGGARGAGMSLGHVFGVNTLGAALAAPLCVGLLPLVGITYLLLAVAAGYLVLVSRRAWPGPAQLFVTAAVIALAVWAPSLAFIELPPGGRVASYIEGSGASVSVIEDARGVATLHINNRQQEGSSATLLADARQGLLPVLLHPAPHRVLFLGLGTGMTSRSAARDPALEVDAVELLPEVIAASAHFAGAFGAERNPRFRMQVADARRFVRTSSDHYDVIVADNFHPARSGSGSLYTVEHFAAVRARLAPDGVFCQWLPLHQLDLETLRSIIRSFGAAYPRTWLILATNSLETPVLGLVASSDGRLLDMDAVHAHLESVRERLPLGDYGLGDDLALLGSFVAGPESLGRFAGGAPLNTDDHPVVAYLAPRVTYAPDSTPRDRLLELLSRLDITPRELIANPQPQRVQRLAAYWQARNLYLEAGHRVTPSADVRAMLRQVREPLLAVLRRSADFRPAYDPLLAMAGALAAEDMPAARELAAALVEVQPARPEAAELLLRLPPVSRRESAALNNARE